MNNLSTIVLGYAAAYLLGSIPFGFIFAKIFGIGDIRAIGSGNIGATNMLRTGRKGVAAATFLADALKGFVAVSLIEACFFYMFFNVYDWRFSMDIYLAVYFSGIMAVLGHIFPVWLGFKGGKGVATAIGTLFAVYPIIGLIVVVVWLTTFLLSKISSLSALTAFTVATIIVITTFDNSSYSLYLVITTLILFFTHRENIRRLLKGEEHQWKKGAAS